MPRGEDWKDLELKSYIKLYDEHSNVTKELSNKLKDKFVANFLENILNQIKNYIGICISDIPIRKSELSTSYENLKQILKEEDVKDITFSKLKEVNSYEYYKLISHQIRILIQNPKYNFIEI